MLGAEGFKPRPSPYIRATGEFCVSDFSLTYFCGIQIFCSGNRNSSRSHLCLWLGILGFFLSRVVLILEETTLAASKFAFWNYLALQLRGSRNCFISSIKFVNTDRQCFLVGFLWIKYCCSTHLGLSVLCPAQLHTCRNLFNTDGASHTPSSFLNLQGIQNHGTSSYSLSNLGDNCGQSGLGLPN